MSEYAWGAPLTNIMGESTWQDNIGETWWVSCPSCGRNVNRDEEEDCPCGFDFIDGRPGR